MASIFAYFFSALFRQPCIGDKYIAWDWDGNPFSPPYLYTVVEIRNGWVKLSHGTNSTVAISVSDLLWNYNLYQKS